MNNTLEEIAQQLNKAKRIAVFCHARPDGDALGAGTALCLHFNAQGKTAYMCCEDAVPQKFLFLPFMSTVKSVLPQGDYDAFISVDCADSLRMGVFAKRFNAFKGVTVNIDHHISNNGFAKYNYVEECPASCEIISLLFKTAGWEITREIADALMLGLITDSGNFTHCDVSERTYNTGALLRRAGADMNAINYHMFQKQPKRRALLYGRVMNDMRFFCEDRVAIIVINQDEMESTGADKSLTEGFVDFPLTIDGVEVAAAVLEFKKGQYKISLRSKGKVNVNEVAAAYGGGGHVLASGCMIYGTEEEVIKSLIDVISNKL